LQGLITTMDDNPRIIIELASHTDARDTYERNDILSQKRAQSVVDYLVLRGIDPDRMVAKGYGERQPRILLKDMPREGYSFKEGDVLTEEYIEALPSTEIKEAAHQLNRRTDFRVLSKDYIPKSKISGEEITQVDIQINPEDNIVKFNADANTGIMIIPCIINGFNEDFYYDPEKPAQVSLEKGLEMLNDGSISKDDFKGDAAEVLGSNTIKNGAVFVIKELRIANRTISNIEVTVSHRLDNPLVFGKRVLQKIGNYSINNSTREITFEYK